jgi:hypothetical protein
MRASFIMWNMQATPWPRLAHDLAERTRDTFGLEAPFAEVEQAVDRAALAHLVIDAGQDDVIALADVAVLADQLARHGEQRDALHPGRQPAVLVGNLGEHEVHDVLGHLVVAARDPHLVAEEAIAAVARRHRARADVRQTRSGLRFGQAHGAEEATLGHRLHVPGHQLWRAMRDQQVGIGDGEEGVARGAGIGRHHVRDPGALHDAGQAHSAEIGRKPGGDQSGVGEGAQCDADLLVDGDPLAVEGRLDAVVLLVVRREEVGRELCVDVEDGFISEAVLSGKACTVRQGLDLQPVEKQEVEVATGKDEVAGHADWAEAGVAAAEVAARRPQLRAASPHALRGGRLAARPVLRHVRR